MVTNQSRNNDGNSKIAPIPGDISVDALRSEFSEFGIFINTDYQLIKINQQLTQDAYEALLKRSNSTSEKPAQHCILDCSSSVEVNSFWVRFCIEHRKRIEVHEKKMRLINVSPIFFGYIQTQGLLTSLQICSNIETALEEVGVKKKPKSFDVQIVNPLLVSTIEVIKNLSTFESTQGKVFTKPGGSPFSGDITGIMQLNCPAFNGLFVVSFPKQTIFNIAGKMLGMTFTDVDKMVLSATGEIANIIFSKGRKEINSKGYGLELSLPKVESSNLFPPEHSQFKNNCIVVPYENSFGNFFSEIRL